MPVEWGVVVSNEGPAAPRPRAILCYVEIPAVDVHQSANFYEKVFGWNIRHRETDRPSFDDAPERVSGAWAFCRISGWTALKKLWSGLRPKADTWWKRSIPTNPAARAGSRPSAIRRET